MYDVILTTVGAASSAALVFKDLIPLAPTAVAILALVYSDMSNRRTLASAKTNAEAAAWQKANETELRVIQEKLDGFFGPFRMKSEVNKLINRDLRNRQNDDRFILIERLFDKSWLRSRPLGEQTMLAEIATNAKGLRTFIETHVGMVDEKIMPYLARASAHFRMLELAYEQNLGDDPRAWVEHYVFPSKVEEVLRLEVERLERRRDYLKANPFKAPPPLPDLQIPLSARLPEWPNPPRAPRPELTAPVA